MRKAIYDATPAEKLKDLARTIESVLPLVEGGEFSQDIRPVERNEEGLAPDEFAIGDWIVRPRFPEGNEIERLHGVIERFRPRREDWATADDYELAVEKWDGALEAEGVDHP